MRFSEEKKINKRKNIGIWLVKTAMETQTHPCIPQNIEIRLIQKCLGLISCSTFNPTNWVAFA